MEHATASLPPEARQLAQEALRDWRAAESAMGQRYAGSKFFWVPSQRNSFTIDQAAQCMRAIYADDRISSTDKRAVAQKALEAQWRLCLMKASLEVEQRALGPRAAVNHRYDCISFPGGGAKGVLFPAILEVYDDQVKAARVLTGSSAGSACAAYVASGMSAQQLDATLEKLPPITFLGNQPTQGSRFKGFKPVEPSLLQHFSSVIANKVEGITGKVAGANPTRPVELYDDGYDMLLRINDTCLQSIRHQLSRFPASPNNAELVRRLREDDLHEITFSDMRQLHQMYPQTFKDLVITGSDVEAQSQVSFCADTHPDMSVALACRISSAINPLFKSVEVQGRLYNDGGFTNNHSVPADNPAVGKTLMFAFDNEDAAHQAVFNHRHPSSKLLVGVLANAVTQHDLEAGEKASADHLYEHGPHVRVIKHPGVGTFDFHVDKPTLMMAQNEAIINAVKERMLYATQHLMPGLEG
jgi:predicted acylesterase/phospholipase RssA